MTEEEVEALVGDYRKSISDGLPGYRMTVQLAKKMPWEESEPWIKFNFYSGSVYITSVYLSVLMIQDPAVDIPEIIIHDVKAASIDRLRYCC